MKKCTKDAENVYAPLVMVSIWGWKRTLGDKTFYQNGSIDTSFDPPLFSLDNTFIVRLFPLFCSLFTRAKHSQQDELLSCLQIFKKLLVRTTMLSQPNNFKVSSHDTVSSKLVCGVEGGGG